MVYGTPINVSPMSFIIAQISDTHLSDSKPFFVDNFQRVAAHLRSVGPDLVVSTGDLSVNGADLREDLEAAHRLHDAIGLEWRAIPGNHDVGDNREIAKKQPFDDERLARWRSVFGADWWTLDAPGWRLLGVNSLLLGSGLEADEEQRAFIRDAVSDIGDRALLLFVHKPLFDVRSDETELSGRFVPPETRRKLDDALGAVRPRLVACGHVHQHRDRILDGVRHVWAPATAFVCPRWFQPDHGVRTVGYVEHRLEPDGSFASCCLPAPGSVIHDLSDFPEAYGDLRQHMATHGTGAAQAAD
jgi:3',5'-cyclic-AMP phosphodiesterase